MSCNKFALIQLIKKSNSEKTMVFSKKIILFISALLFLSTLRISAQIPIGEWRTQLPYNRVIDVALAGDIVFAATEYSMFTYNTMDNSVERFDKVTGLSDVGIVRIGFSQNADALLVAYSNTNLDLIRSNGSIINISDIKDKDILGKKTINNIMFRDKYAYLSCGFGIVVLDLVREEIHDTYYIGPEGSAIEVLDMAYNDTSFFAATESGIYYADINANNLADFNQWRKDLTMKHPDLPYNVVQSFGGKIYANYYAGGWDGDSIYVYNGSSWENFLSDNISRRFQMLVKDEFMYVVSRYDVLIIAENGTLDNTIWNVAGDGIQPYAIDRGNDQYLWIGDEDRGLIKNWNIFQGEEIKPNGPGTTNVFDMDAEGKKVWVAPGGRQGTWAKLYMLDGVFTYQEDLWNTYNFRNTPAFDTMTDMVCVKVDPTNPNIAYIGTWDKGLVKFENNELVEVYDDKNSSLQRWIGDPTKTLVSGVDFDDRHNLWVANTSAPDILSVLKNDGTWKSYNLGGSLSGVDVAELMVDNYNQKWIKKRKDGFIIVFSDNGTIDDTSDDMVKVLNQSSGNGAIPGTGVYSFATDLDGEVWVGSDKGVCVFYSPERIFEQGANFDAQQILVPRNDGSGLADILLETEVVTAITVDGANRKWIGTERAGVFHLSEDGLEQLAHFTETNSPLLSNNITSITIDSDGEVFIGTARGIVSYRGTATPSEPGDSKVYAFPNPVRENYTGLIAIKGLENNSSVKITDSYGNLVFETRSEGGQAIWDGYNFDGRRAATGVYLVFATDSDGSEKAVTKILFVNGNP
jgi:ligand-binding sensor domain-containing protein